MFIALRDLRFAKGRFALLGGVITLMTFMVVMLGGLTAGLGAASISAVKDLPVDAIAFAQPARGQAVSFTSSALSPTITAELAAEPGVRTAQPLGVATTQLHGASSTSAVTLIGTDPGLFPSRHSGAEPGPGQIAVGATLARSQGLGLGDTLDADGVRVTIAAIVTDTSFNHLPAVYTTIGVWQRITHADKITAVGLRLAGGTAPASLDSPAVHVLGKNAAFAAVGSYSSEQGSLNLMRGLLIAVSVLIVGSFFTVWTMQRAGDLAVVRAIGGSRRYLLRDALGQALIVLVVGAAAGAALALAAGALAAAVVPFALTPAGAGLPLAAMVGVGLVGAAISVRKVTTIDPLTALGAAR